MPPHGLPDLKSQQQDTLLCLFGFFSLSLSLTDKALKDNKDKQDMYLLLDL